MPCPFATTAQLLYGKVGDAIALTATAPLERLTVVLQVSSSTSDGLASTYSRLITEQGGLSALWQGNTVSKIYFSVYKTLTVKVKEYVWANHREWFLTPKGKAAAAIQDDTDDDKSSEKKGEEEDPDALYAAQTKASLLAGCLTVAVLYPLNYSLTHLLVAGDSSTKNATLPDQTPWNGFGIQEVVTNAVKQGGILTLYRGMGMALAGMVSQQGSSLVLYQRFVLKAANKDKLSEKDKMSKTDEKENFWSTWKGKFAMEQLVSCVACCLSFPYETMSRRLQLTDPSVPVSASTMKDVSGDLYNIGIVPALVRTVLMNSFLAAFNSEAASDLLRDVVKKIHG